MPGIDHPDLETALLKDLVKGDPVDARISNNRYLLALVPRIPWSDSRSTSLAVQNAPISDIRYGGIGY